MADRFNFSRVKRNMEQVKKELPVILANQAQNFFADSWKKQGWDDGGLKVWQTPNRKIPGTKEYEYPKKKGLGRRTRATLVQSGRLRRAIASSIRQKSFSMIRLVVAVPYAKYHNEGTDTIPKRQFMGDSRTLRRIQVESINKTVDKIWQA